MKSGLRILIIGTADTKSDELLFMKQCVEREGAFGIIMDVGVLGTPVFDPEISNAKVAAAAGMSLKEVAALGDENAAMTKMAEGAVKLTLDLYAKDQVHGVLRSRTRRHGSAAARHAEVHRDHGRILASDSARSTCSRRDDDPMGGRTLWAQFDLQGNAQSSRGRCSRRLQHGDIV